MSRFRDAGKGTRKKGRRREEGVCERDSVSRGSIFQQRKGDGKRGKCLPAIVAWISSIVDTLGFGNSMGSTTAGRKEAAQKQWCCKFQAELTRLLSKEQFYFTHFITFHTLSLRANYFRKQGNCCFTICLPLYG